MDQSSIPILPLIPYAQASPAQLAQALFTAKEALGLPYAAIEWSQWYEAFAYFQPLLVFELNRVSFTAEGLTAVAQYFDTRYPSSVPVSPLPQESTTLPPVLEVVSQHSALPHAVKRTYLLRRDVLTSLERVSFWQRVSKSTLVNLAVEQLMATYSESKVPLPLIEV